MSTGYYNVYERRIWELVDVDKEQRLSNLFMSCSVHKKTLTSFSVQLHPMVPCVAFHKCPFPGQTRVDRDSKQNKYTMYNNNNKYISHNNNKYHNILNSCNQIWYMALKKYTLFY